MTRDISDLLAENAELRKELAENEAEDSRQFKLYEEWRDRALAAEAEVVKLREALVKYGGHQKPCNIYRRARHRGEDGIWRDEPCNCGYASALNPGAGKEEA